MDWEQTREQLIEYGFKGLPERWQWRIDLTSKFLGSANLEFAYLRGANLKGAYLVNTNLAIASLEGADLEDANLMGANLEGATLRGANLEGATLRSANLEWTNLEGAILRDAYLIGTNLTDAILTGAYLEGATFPTKLVIPDLDKRILGIIATGEGKLEMCEWHTCQTTHCRAGWAITLAGEAGRVLEDIYGASVAGAIIYASTYPLLPVPDFYVSNEEALEDICYRAGLSK